MDSRTQASIQRLAKQRAPIDPLQPVAAPKQILATTALGRDPSSSASGSGIASPLTETARSLHATQAVSSDGLFVWSLPDTITMSDANGVTVEFIYAAP